jgi:hypothetical protein
LIDIFLLLRLIKANLPVAEKLELRTFYGQRSEKS